MFVEHHRELGQNLGKLLRACLFFSQEEWSLRKDEGFLKIHMVGMIEKCLFFKLKVIPGR